jgi:LysM domain
MAMVLASRSTGMRRAGALLALVVFEIVAVVVLHRLGELSWLRIPFDDLEGWLQTSAPEDVLAAVVRLIALGAAWWLLGSTALYALARISRIPGAVRAVEWFTLPSVRRLADQALALTLATSIVSGGANAALASPTGMLPSRPGAVVNVHDPLTTWASASTFGYRPTTTTPGEPGYQPEAAGGPTATTAGAAPQAGDGRPSYRPEAAGTDAAPSTAPSSTAAPSTAAPSTTPPSAAPSSTAAPSTTPPSTTPPSTTPPSTAAPSTTPPSTATPSTRGSAAAKPPAAAYVPRPAGQAPSSTRPPAPAPPGYTPAPAGRPAPTDRAEAGRHRVVEGDNLWAIARDHLARATGRRAGDLTEREVARYWLDVVDANRSGLRSGDPDLIFPGEMIKLPPVDRREP